MKNYSLEDPNYEDIRCVYLAIPGGMGVEECASVAFLSDGTVKWKSYDLYKSSEEEKFKTVFPPFKEFGYELAYEYSLLDGWGLICLTHSQSILLHESIYGKMVEYKRRCDSPKVIKLNRFGRSWSRAVEAFMTGKDSREGQ